jgi:hypothetical protein
VDIVEPYLRSYRKKYPDCFIEGETTRKNDSHFIYRTPAVLPDLRIWAEEKKAKMETEKKAKNSHESRTDRLS